MSNALAIAGVTAVLRDLLDSGMIDHEITDAMGQGVSVSAVAPDTVPIEGSNAKPQINIFLYQVTPNAAMRNLDLPARNRNGVRLSNPPLALDLHYLITAYGVGDLQSEVLLGYAMQLLHETPVPARAAIRAALNPPDMPVDGTLLPSVYQALRASDLAEQYEQIKITPTPMNTEEMSKLWSAIQAHYRPTAAYQVSVLLIESRRPARSALPVLTRGKSEPLLSDPTTSRERGVAVRTNLLPAIATLETITLPLSRVAAHLGDAIVVSGRFLDGVDHSLLLTLPRLGVEYIAGPATSVDPQNVGFDLTNDPTLLPAGSYLLTVRIVRPGEAEARSSNSLLLQVAPEITNLQSPPEQVARDAQLTATIVVTCRPEVQANQRASLLLGDREVVAETFNAATDTLTFKVDSAPVGTHYVRLRVDGVDSQLIDRTASPPRFLDHQIEIT